MPRFDICFAIQKAKANLLYKMIFGCSKFFHFFFSLKTTNSLRGNFEYDNKKKLKIVSFVLGEEEKLGGIERDFDDNR